MSDRSIRTVLTGAGGFLGFHTKALLRSQGTETSDLRLGHKFDADSALRILDGAERVVHIAGVNRGSVSEIEDGNLLFARQLAETLDRCQVPPTSLTFANSIQAGNESAYGQAKAQAADELATVTARLGIDYTDISLPNLFGEHGQPFYNSVTSTFCHLLARGESPEVLQDKPLRLMHAQHAAEFLIGERSTDSLNVCIEERTVEELLRELSRMAETYRDGTIPALNSGFERDLFNTYRSYLKADDRVFTLDRRADNRGSFFEVTRAQSTESQTSFSTTVPGVTRGQHFHLRKIERFTVLSGEGTISMRRLWDDKVVTFRVSGNQPVAVDMPTMWAHNIANTGTDIMYTAFWINEIFDPKAPDTFAENV